MKMDEIFYEHWQYFFSCENLNKTNKMEKFDVGLFQKIQHMKC